VSLNLARLLSYVWPVRVWKGAGAKGELELTWEYGRLVVNSANANQSFGSSHRVWRAAFRDEGILHRSPATALVLGYGAGSVAHILLNELGLDTIITGVDHDEKMFQLAREHFPLKRMERLRLVVADAFEFAARSSSLYDMVVVDLFEDLDFAQGVERAEFLVALRRLVSPEGLLLINTVAHDEKSALRSARLADELRLVFTEVKEHHYDVSNRVFIAL
jgi:spermidine synthase